MTPQPPISDARKRVRDATRRLERLERQRAEALAERNAAYHEARAEDPPVSLRTLAEDAGVSPEAVAKVLRAEVAERVA